MPFATKYVKRCQITRLNRATDQTCSPKFCLKLFVRLIRSYTIIAQLFL